MSSMIGFLGNAHLCIGCWGCHLAEDKLQGLLLSQLITETAPFLHQSLLIIWQACLVLAVMELDTSNLSGVSSQQA